MPEFRKKPVVIEAVQYDGSVENALAISHWAHHRQLPDSNRIIGLDGLGALTVRTLEGTMTATAGDWIICGVKGEFYPCKPDIFEATYEPVAPVPAGGAPE